MADETIRIELKAIGAKDYEARMKAASKATQHLDNVTQDYWKTERGLAIQRKAANTQIGTLNRSSRTLDNTIEGLRKSAQSLGGKLGEMSEKSANAADAFALLGGPGSALVATTVAVVALGTAGVASALKMSTLIDTLEELGAKDYATRQQRQQAKEIDDLLKDLKISTSQIALAYGEEFAPGVITAANAVVILSEGFNRLDDATSGGWLEDLSSWGTTFATLPWQAAKAGINGIAGAWEELDQAVADGDALVERIRNEAEADLISYGVDLDSLESAEDQQKRLAEEAKKREEAEKKAAAEKKKRDEEIAKIAKERAREQDKEAKERLRQEIEAERARRADMDRRVALSRTMQAERQQQQAEEIALQKQIEENEKRKAALIKEAQDQQLADAAARKAENERAAMALVNATADASALIIDLIDTRTKAGKKAAMVAFRVNQGLNLASAIGNVANGITQAYTLPFPANFLQAAAIGTAGAAQIAKIASTRPQFHRGTAGSPEADEMLLRQGERAAILTSQAQEAGAAEAVNRGNAGLSVGDTALTLQVDHRYFDAQVSSASRRAGSGLRRMERRNRRAIGHSRRSRK